MVLTSSGIVDAWDGRADLESGLIRILEPAANADYRNPQALFEQHARLPSYLIALSATCRLRMAWRKCKPARSPDLKCPLAPKISDVALADPVTTWTERTKNRVGKLGRSLAELAQATNSSEEEAIAPHFRSAVDRLRRLISGTRVTGSEFEEFLKGANIYING
jgi:hypothetical protein